MVFHWGHLRYDGGMGYAILRTQKLKHAAAVRRSMAHALREQDTPNADPSRTPENTASAASVDVALTRFNERLATQEKLRSNAVLAVEYLVTASPDDLNGKTRQQQDDYFTDALKWLEAKHGKENIVAWGIHRDETTPHLYAVVVPIDDKGKLNCRAFLGGAKALNAMQSDFYNAVGQRHGLQRGIEGSRAKHTAISDYYKRLKRPINKPEIKIPEPSLSDRLKPAEYGQRVAEVVLSQVMPEIETAAATRLDFELNKQGILARQKALEKSENVIKKAKSEAIAALEKTQTVEYEAIRKTHELNRIYSNQNAVLEELKDLPENHKSLQKSFFELKAKLDRIESENSRLRKENERHEKSEIAFNQKLKIISADRRKELQETIEATASTVRQEVEAAHETAMQDLKNQLHEARSRLDDLVPQLELADRLQAVCDANRVWPETILDRLEANQDEVIRLRDLDDSPGCGY
jgi:hypothetical protein